MSMQTWQETLINQNVDGTALTASTTPTSIIHPSAKLTLPANYLRVGSIIKLTAQGRISNVVTTPGTLTIDVRMGPTSNIVVANGGAIALNTTAKTNVAFWLEILMTCRAIGNGTSTNFMFQGTFTSESVFSAAAGTANTAMLPASAPTVGTGFDSTVASVVDLFATWSLNNANSIQTHQFKIESFN